MGDRLGISGAVDFYMLAFLTSKHLAKIPFMQPHRRLRPYHVESTGSRPIPEVKQRRARSVPGWETAWEYWVQ